MGMRVVALDPEYPAGINRATVNPHWMGCIKSCFHHNDDCRMIVFAGRAHVDPSSGSLYTLLADAGISTSLVEFAGLEKMETAQMDYKTAHLLGLPVHPTTLITLDNSKSGQHANFMIPCLVDLTRQNASNWIINLVQSQDSFSLLLARR